MQITTRNYGPRLKNINKNPTILATVANGSKYLILTLSATTGITIILASHSGLNRESLGHVRYSYGTTIYKLINSIHHLFQQYINISNASILQSGLDLHTGHTKKT